MRQRGDGTYGGAVRFYVQDKDLQRVVLSAIRLLGLEEDERIVSGFAAFCKHLSHMKTADVSWDELSSWSETRRQGDVRCVALIVCLLKEGLYVRDHSSKLYSIADWMESAVIHSKIRAGGLLCGPDIEYVIPLDDFGNTKVESKSTLIRCAPEMHAILSEYLQNERTTRNERCAAWFYSDFPESLGPLASSIVSAEDFNGATFWQQVSYYRKKYCKQESKLRRAFKCLVFFYRYLDEAYAGIFDNSPNMSSALINSRALPKMLKLDYWFGTFTPGMEIGDQKRVCLLAYGYDQYSTRHLRDSYLTLDISCLKSTFYRTEILKYFTSSIKTAITQVPQIYVFLAKALQALKEAKGQPGYPNPSLSRLNSAEAAFLEDYVRLSAENPWTCISRIGVLRNFFAWEVESRGKIIVDSTFFDYLRQFKGSPKGQGRALSREEIAALHNWFEKQDSSLMRAAHVAFILLLETELRISAICGLQTGCITPGTVSNQFIIKAISKTSHGSKENFVITASTRKKIQDQVEATEPIRERCQNASMADCIFLYEEKDIRQTIKCLRAHSFGKALTKACSELGLPHYTATNLRDTRMTLAHEYILRRGKSDAELSVLSRHKHLDTTKNHYIDQEFRRMLEATGGVLLDDGDDIGAARRVVDKLPSEAESSSRIVEQGCGACIAPDDCDGIAYECRVCKNFRTTPAHEQFWYEDIERQKAIIESLDIPHAKEDRLHLIRIASLYLLAIEELKGRNSDDRG